MEKNKQLELTYLFLVVSLSVLLKWVLLFVFYDNHLFSNILLNIQDKQYFPIIISVSNFILSPTYLDTVMNEKIISFPLYGVIFHSFFFKFFGVYSLIILEYFFQLIFFYVFFITINHIFKEKKKTLIFCILILTLLLFLDILSSNSSLKFVDLIFSNLDENLGSRVPRPLITGIFYFLFYFVIFKIIEDFKFNFNFKYFLFTTIILSVFLNSFFYYFINFTILFLYLIYSYNKNHLNDFLSKNLKNFLILAFISVILISPFIIQIIYGQSDYSNRIGLIELSFEKKISLTKYYFLNLFRLEFLILFFLCLIIHIYLNKFDNDKYYLIKKINIFFYFIIISIISPIIFFILSPFVISIYHFLNILIFSFLFYLLITIFHISFSKINFFNDSKIYKYFLIIFVFSYCYANLYSKNSGYKKENLYNEINSIQNFFDTKNLNNTKLKLFTNDLNIMNLWLFNENTELVISDGFTNSLENSQIEYNLINSLKSFQLSENDFKKLISFNESELRNPLIMTLFIYRYQANSLYTFSDIENYTDKYREIILNTSPFRAQFQIMPEDEKKRLLKMFNDHQIDEKFASDLVILNNSLFERPIDLRNSDYKKIYYSKNFEIYRKIINN